MLLGAYKKRRRGNLFLRHSSCKICSSRLVPTIRETKYVLGAIIRELFEMLIGIGIGTDIGRSLPFTAEPVTNINPKLTRSKNQTSRHGKRTWNIMVTKVICRRSLSRITEIASLMLIFGSSSLFYVDMPTNGLLLV